MNKLVKVLAAVLVLLMVFTACGKEDVDGGKYAGFIDDNGRWKDVVALDTVTLSDYKAIQISKSEITPLDDEIQNTVDSLFASAAYNNEIDGVVEDGMTLNIDYVGKIDGVEFENGSTQGNGAEVTIGVTNYIDDFLEQLIGHRTGETFTIEVTFPDPYENNPDLAGKDATFDVTINHIIEKVVPEQTDENVEKYLKDTYKVSTLEDLKKDIYDEFYESNLLEKLNDALLESCTVGELPDAIYNFYFQFYKDYYTQYAQTYGYGLEEFLELLGFDSIDAIIEDSKEDIEEGGKFSMIVQAIAEKEEITVSVEDTENYMKDILGLEDLDSYIEFYGYNYFRKSTMLYKVQTMLEEAVTFID